MSNGLNPFANLPLRIPKSQRERVDRFTQTHRDEKGQAADIDRAPFRRYVDVWWAGVCLGANLGDRQPIDDPHDFVTGVVFNSDPYRIVELQLLALAETGDPDVLAQPGEILRIANEYAAVGVSRLTDVMTGHVTPIWATTELLNSAIAGSEST